MIYKILDLLFGILLMVPFLLIIAMVFMITDPTEIAFYVIMVVIVILFLIGASFVKESFE